MTRRILWIVADLVMIAIILALLAAVLYPAYLGPSDQGEDRRFPTRQRERR